MTRSSAARKNDAHSMKDGSTALLTANRLELRGPNGELRILYEEGRVTLYADADEVVLQSRGTVSIEGEAGIRLASPKQISIEADQVDLRSKAGSWTSERVELVATLLETTADRARTTSRVIETTCARLVERSREVLRETSGLVDERAGRVRTLVSGAYRLVSKRTSIESHEDTRVDGKRVLLG